MANPNFSVEKDMNLSNVNCESLEVGGDLTVGGLLVTVAGGALSTGSGAVSANNPVTVVDAAINPAVANTHYLVGPITVNRAVTMPAGTTAGQSIVFELVGLNANNADLVITCPANLAAGSTLVVAAAGTAQRGVVAGANNILTIAGDNNGGGGIGTTAVFTADGTTWRCTAVGYLSGNGSAADASAFS